MGLARFGGEDVSTQTKISVPQMRDADSEGRKIVGDWRLIVDSNPLSAVDEP